MSKKNPKNKNPSGEFSMETLRKIVEDVVLPSNQNFRLDIDTKIENMAIMMSRHFNNLEQKISSNDQRLILTREEILRKLDGTNVRIDDLSMNRAKYDDLLKLQREIENFNRLQFRKVKK